MYVLLSSLRKADRNKNGIKEPKVIKHPALRMGRSGKNFMNQE